MTRLLKFNKRVFYFNIPYLLYLQENQSKKQYNSINVKTSKKLPLLPFCSIFKIEF